MGPLVGAAIAAIPSIIGMMSRRGEDNRQLSQQEKLTKMQLQAQTQLNRQNKNLSMEMWNQTNYGAQVEHLRKAGLNTGLIYGMGGSGGATTNTGAGGSISGGQASHYPTSEKAMGLQAGIEAALAAAQTQKLQAETKNIEVDTEKKAGVDTEQTKTSTEVLSQQVQNEKLKRSIMEYEKEMAKIEAEVKQRSQEDTIEAIRQGKEKLEAEARSAKNQAEIDETTYNEVVQQITQNTTEQQIRMGLLKADIIKTGTQTAEANQAIKKMAAEIVKMSTEQRQQWLRLDQEAKELWIKEQLMNLQQKTVEFQTSTPNQMKQWTDLLSNIIQAMPKK